MYLPSTLGIISMANCRDRTCVNIFFKIAEEEEHIYIQIQLDNSVYQKRDLNISSKGVAVRGKKSSCFNKYN